MRIDSVETTQLYGSAPASYYVVGFYLQQPALETSPAADPGYSVASYTVTQCKDVREVISWATMKARSLHAETWSLAVRAGPHDRSVAIIGTVPIELR